MAEARHELDWDERFRLALYGEHARKIHERDGETETCSMCGELCEVKMVNELFGTAPKGKGKMEMYFLKWSLVFDTFRKYKLVLVSNYSKYLQV